MPSPKERAERFCRLDFHGDTLVDVRIFPPQRREKGKDSAVEIQLYRYWERKLRVVRFSGCMNLRVAMDFDVLAGNLNPNTSSVHAHTEVDRMKQLILSQQGDWDVEYEPAASSPLPRKLELLDGVVFFRVQFFGGTLDVIASRYRVKTANP